MTTIEDLWGEHLTAKFPPSCYDAALVGTDLVELDATIAGCAQSAVEDKKLSKVQIEALMRCRVQLEKALRTLQGQEKEYFTRLDSLAASALQRTK